MIQAFDDRLSDCRRYERGHAHGNVPESLGKTEFPSLCRLGLIGGEPMGLRWPKQVTVFCHPAFPAHACRWRLRGSSADR